MDLSRTFSQMENDSRNYGIIDIRPEKDFNAGTISGARHIDYEDFPESEKDIKELTGGFGFSGAPVYVLCQSGRKSIDIAERLTDCGIEAYSLEGGYSEYLRIELKRMLESDSEVKSGLTFAGKVERSIQKKFRQPIWSKFTKALKDFDLIEDGDRIAVCISGGKDSMLMAKLFQELSRHGIHNFEVVFLVMNPGYNDINYETVLNNAKLLNIPIQVFKTDIFNIVAGDAGYKDSGSPCYLCARMRRGNLYSKARELGCNKIALGHHFDDVIETTLMAMLYAGQIQTMVPKLKSKNFEGMELIRPLYYIRERDIIHWRDYNDLHFINCACRLTESCASCGGTEKGSKRAEVKEIIKKLEERDPVIPLNIFRSMENVDLPMVLSYKDRNGRHEFNQRFESEEL